MEDKKQSINWLIHKNPAETHALAISLESAIAKKDKKAIADILRKKGNIRSLIVRLGINCKYVQLLRESFFILLEEKDKQLCKSNIAKLLKKYNFDYFFLAEMAATAFHLIDKDFFFGIIAYFNSHKNELINTEAYLFALNALASWEGSYNQNHERNLEINKEIIGLARKNNLKIIEQKAKFALSDHKAFRSKKTLKPSLRINDFITISEVFKKYDICYDALRSEQAKLKGLNCIIEATTDKNEKEKIINEALKLGKQQLTEIKAIDYPKALIYIKHNLAHTYLLAGNTKNSIRLNKEAEKLIDLYQLENLKKPKKI